MLNANAKKIETRVESRGVKKFATLSVENFRLDGATLNNFSRQLLSLVEAHAKTG